MQSFLVTAACPPVLGHPILPNQARSPIRVLTFVSMKEREVSSSPRPTRGARPWALVPVSPAGTASCHLQCLPYPRHRSGMRIYQADDSVRDLLQFRPSPLSYPL